MPPPLYTFKISFCIIRTSISDARKKGVSMKYWYLVSTKPQKDSYAQEQLINQDYEVYRPVTNRIKTRANKKVQITESLFPRYLFVRMENGVDDWGPVRSTRGVAGVVKFGAQAAKVEDSLINEIKSREKVRGEQTIDRDNFKKGQAVKVTQGAFSGLDAVFASYNGEQRVIVLLNILGNQTRLTIKTASLAPA